MPPRSVDERQCCCFPDWLNAGGSSSEIKSKSTPIDVRLSSPGLAELVVPHASRLVSLTLRLDDSHSLSQVVRHLDYPIHTSFSSLLMAPDYTPRNFLQFSRTPPFYTRRSWKSRESRRWLDTKSSLTSPRSPYTRTHTLGGQ